MTDVTALTGDAMPTDANSETDEQRPVGLDPAGIERAVKSIAKSSCLDLMRAAERNQAYGIAVQAIAAYVGN